MRYQSEPGAAAKPLTWTAEREQEWRKAKYKRMVADLPHEQAEAFTAALHAQGIKFQRWLREESQKVIEQHKQNKGGN